MSTGIRKTTLALALASGLFVPPTARAQQKIRVVTTLPVFATLTRAIGGDRVEVQAIASPVQDPHFVDAKPSYILAASKADLFIEAGMDLEVGWAPLVQEQARNAAIQVGAPGYVDASVHVRKLDVPQGKVDRSRGDVHPYGNPHYWLDPLNAVPLTADIALALTRLDPRHAGYYNDRRRNFLAELERRMGDWNGRMAPLKGLPVVTYHESWEYFAKRFDLDLVGFMEPKPGIPPSPSHLAKLIDRMKATGAKLVFKEPYYESRNPELVARQTGAAIVELPNQPQPGQDYFAFIDTVVGDVVQAAHRSGAVAR